MPQSAWGCGSFTLAATRFIALAINGAWRPTLHILPICSMFNVLLWFLVTFAIGHPGAASLGLAVYPWFFLGDAYSMFRAAGEARLANDAAKLATVS